MNIDKEKTLQQLNALRGLFAVEIIIGHTVRYQQGILYPLGKFMICAVAFFFFVSALGMVVSFHKKENYLAPIFLKDKVIYLFLIAIITYCFNIIVDYLVPQYDLHYCNGWNSIKSFFFNTNWYLWHQMLFYIIFYIVYKYMSWWRIPVMCTITVILPILFYLIGASEGWYASSYGFALGIIVGEKYDDIKLFFDGVYGKIVTVILAVFGCASLFIKNETLLSMVFMRNSICIASLVIIIYIAKIELFGNNIVSRWLTSYSLELYVTQFVWLRLVDYLNLNYWVRILFVLVCTVISALCMHIPFKFLKSAIRGKSNGA